MVDIEFNMENVQKCLCPGCPVQAQSSCVKEKLDKLKSMSGSPGPEDVPGLYCATGKAKCGDLDPKQMCQCGKCEIFAKYDLSHGKPAGYFCANGKAR